MLDITQKGYWQPTPSVAILRQSETVPILWSASFNIGTMTANTAMAMIMTTRTNTARPCPFFRCVGFPCFQRLYTSTPLQSPARNDSECTYERGKGFSSAEQLNRLFNCDTPMFIIYSKLESHFCWELTSFGVFGVESVCDVISPVHPTVISPEILQVGEFLSRFDWNSSHRHPYSIHWCH